MRNVRIKDRCKIWMKEMDITTYSLGPYNPNPVFYCITGAHVYPYPYCGSQTIDKKKVRYKLVFLENEYLRLIVFPEMGGRLWSAYDKTIGKEIFFRGDVVKPYNTGIGYGYMAGGMELNFPDAHSITNIRPREYSVYKNEDGSVTVVISETERIYRMRWSVSFTLYPGRAYIEQKVRVYNRTPLPARYRYWSNAGIMVSEDIQFLYPEVKASQHGGEHSYFSWPIFDGIDISYFKNVKEVLGLYMMNVKDDYFGYYDHKLEKGVVHHSNYHELPGKKYWSWGSTEMGIRQSASHTDKKEPYGEIQSGRLENQEHFDILEPFRTLEWTEYWYPIRKMGPFKNANKDVAANLEIIDSRNLKIGINAPVLLKGVSVIVRFKNEVLFKKRTDIGPEKPFIEIFDYIVTEKEQSKFSLHLYSRDGGEIITCSTEHKKCLDSANMINMNLRESVHEKQNTEDLYLKGQWQGKIGDINGARRLYAKSLEEEPGYSKSHRAIGLLNIKEGRCDEAYKELKLAIERDPYNTKARYYLGLLLKLRRMYNEAKDELWLAMRYGEEASGYHLLGEIALLEKKYDEAVDLLDKAVCHNEGNLKAKVLRGVTLRKLGMLHDAKKVVLDVLNIDRTDIFGIVELYFIKREIKEKEAEDELHRAYNLIQNHTHTHLEVAIDYGNIGCFSEALKLIDYIRNKDPIVQYYKGYYNAQMGKIAISKRYYTIAGKLKKDYCFPHRLETEIVLRHVISLLPEEASAHYYLGTLLFSKNRVEEGVREWEKAERLGEGYSMLYRNLGLYHWKMKQDLDKAIVYYKKAFSIDKNNPYIMDELGDIYKQKRKRKECVNLYEDNIKIVKDRHHIGCITKLINTYIELKMYEKAIQLLKIDRRDDHSKRFYDLYEQLHMNRGIERLEKGEFKNAAKDLEKALNPPKNLGHYRLPTEDLPNYTRIMYYLGIVYEGLRNKEKAQETWYKAVSKQYLAFWEPARFYNMWTARYYQALCLQKLGRFTEASVYLDGLREYALRDGHSQERKNYLLNLVETGRKMRKREKDVFDQRFALGEMSVED